MNWISVNDKLPDNDDMVIVWNKDDVEFGRYDSNRQQWVDYTEVLSRVTHWMQKHGSPNGYESPLYKNNELVKVS